MLLARLLLSIFQSRGVQPAKLARHRLEEFDFAIQTPAEWSRLDFAEAVVFAHRHDDAHPHALENLRMPPTGMLLLFTLSATTIELESFAYELSAEQRVPQAQLLLQTDTPQTPMVSMMTFDRCHANGVLSFFTEAGIVSAALFVGKDVPETDAINYRVEARKALENCMGL